MKILAIVIAALGCQLCLGQSLTISGRIVDEQHRPVPFANVVLLHGSDTLSMVQGTASRADTHSRGSPPERIC